MIYLSGTVISVKKQWWLKINTKAIRRNTWDGAIFPHIITVRYIYNGTEYSVRKWIKASVTPPQVGDTLRLAVDENKPSKAKIESN